MPRLCLYRSGTPNALVVPLNSLPADAASLILFDHLKSFNRPPTDQFVPLNKHQLSNVPCFSPLPALLCRLLRYLRHTDEPLPSPRLRIRVAAAESGHVAQRAQRALPPPRQRYRFPLRLPYQVVQLRLCGDALRQVRCGAGERLPQQPLGRVEQEWRQHL